MIPSPITGGKTVLIGKILTAPIIKYYKSYDISPLFRGLTEVEIYQCVDTGYKFFYPYFIAGDDKFYQNLSHEILYYQTWKWEHVTADAYINTGDKVLELGCANGDFLAAEIRQKKIEAFGTELNSVAKKNAEERGIRFDTISNADVVCAFQVLEHIADVKTFISEALNATVTGGYIIFGVPNDSAFIGKDRFAYLNKPPHHMGIWSPKVFEKLPKYFDMELISIHTETLQPYHYRYYYQVAFGDNLVFLGFIGKVLNKLIFELLAKHIIKYKAHSITGHTMIGVFKKK